MKIGILTFHRAINFGAVLQCYALYRTLSDMGHDVEVIDYRPVYIEKYRKLLYWKNYKKLGLLKKIKNLIFLPLTYRNKKKSAQVFDAFLNKHINTSKIVKDANDISSYDVIFFGSDQRWNPRICEGYDPLYYGQFPKGKTKFVSYAASLGTPQNLNKEQWDKIFLLLKSFDAISVRETKLTEYLQSGGIEAQSVLDPTLLASKDIFERIVEKPRETGYVLLYMLEEYSNAIEFAKNIAKQKNLKLIRVRAQASQSIRKRNSNEVIPNSVGEFLGYFKYADYVVNISFHGTAFSVIFNKNFYTLKSRNFERAYGLLDSLGLLSRFVSSDETVLPSHINYSKTNIKVTMMRESSINFICDSLKLNKIKL